MYRRLRGKKLKRWIEGIEEHLRKFKIWRWRRLYNRTSTEWRQIREEEKQCIVCMYIQLERDIFI